MSQPPPVEDAMRAIISDFWRDGRVTPATTIARLQALAASR
jgi:glucose/mannose transport system substrate-binding protein